MYTYILYVYMNIGPTLGIKLMMWYVSVMMWHVSRTNIGDQTGSATPRHGHTGVCMYCSVCVSCSLCIVPNEIKTPRHGHAGVWHAGVYVMMWFVYVMMWSVYVTMWFVYVMMWCVYVMMWSVCLHMAKAYSDTDFWACVYLCVYPVARDLFRYYPQKYSL